MRFRGKEKIIMEEILITKQKGKIFFMELNRPDKYNALSNDLMDKIFTSLCLFRDDQDLHVAVISGAGKNFCSGADIKQFDDADAQTPEAIAKRADTSMRVHLLFSQIAKPIITSVRGYALAGGCGIAMAGDFAIASENAVFGYPEIKRGFVPALVLINLSKLVGRRFALELLLTGDKINASKALEHGMVNKIAPDGQLEQKTLELAEQLASYSSGALSSIKKQFYAATELSLEEGLLKAKTANIEMRQTKDFASGAKKFKEGVE
jgi:enoyl-CoA hydratase/carnithine racemase